jgi:tetratricopeptide (TPR) repeat protein
MDLRGISNPDTLFAVTVQQPAQLESLANNALKHGIDLYMRQDYKAAIKEFNRSVRLSPYSSHAVDAANYMAKAYLSIDDTDGAIKAYQTAIRLGPMRDDSHINLGNLYFSRERYQEAAEEYEKAVKFNPSSGNYFALGQAYINTGRYSDAEPQFDQVLRMEPDKPNGNFGLGLNYSKQGRYDEAIGQFQQAISKDRHFYDAYAELGYAYADSGQMDEAQRQVDLLNLVDPELSGSLSSYMYEVDPPKFVFTYSTDFRYSMPMRTPLTSLDIYLETADAAKTFTMKFQFDKRMSRETVENRFNWQIGRSTANGAGQAYNFGFSIPDTEVTLSPFPDQVIYDSDSMMATVYFTIKQNATADGTIDPSHIEFKFSGKDIYGNSMDEDFDQFMGFSGVA